MRKINYQEDAVGQWVVSDDATAIYCGRVARTADGTFTGITAFGGGECLRTGFDSVGAAVSAVYSAWRRERQMPPATHH